MKTNVIIGLCIVIALLTAGSASAWLDPYTYRQSITLTGGSDGAQTDYQIKLTIPYDADMQTDFDDIRFTQSDGATLVDAWLESKIDSTSAVVWVEFPTTPANGINQTYYMYYGNAGAASDWDIGATFLLGDDFLGSSLGAKWNQDYTSCSATATVSGGMLTLDAGSGCGGNLQRMVGSVNTFQSNDVALRYRHNVNAASNHVGYTWMTNTKPPTTPADGYHTQFTPSSSRAYDVVAASHIAGASQSKTCCDNVYSQNTWYTIEMQRIGNDYKTLVDDAVKIEDSRSGLSTVDMYVSLGIWVSGPTSWDWFTLRKHVASPPSSAFGGEETSQPPAIPVITAYNNITGTRSHVPLDYGTTVMFNATVNGSVTWSWALDGVNQSVSDDNYVHTFSAGFGYYAVTVNATNALGTDTYTWGIWENIETTAETIPTFTDTSYQMLLDSIDYPPDMEDFGKAMAHPFVQMVGVIFYLFIFGIPLLMMYIRQDNMTMPTTLLLLFGSIIIFMLPPQWQIIAGALMTLGFVGILFKLYKERER